uniref:modular serine protease-like n=1 Tax=Vespula vulgaris TaxID=7454 RepID=UPI00223BDC06|nr:modular serine protease-like [Vespula vulgaris]
MIIKIIILVQLLYFFTAFLNIVSTQERRKCGIEKFQCDNGNCIANEFLCDGQANCKDQSDETQSECSKPQLMCSPYAFRCNYGACIDGDLICNGKQDCIDNSDETLARCLYSMQNITTSIKCSINQFKCDNGQCIDFERLCNGDVDCRDHSDETFSKCGSLYCNELLFRCNYGACIDGNLQCNGIINCADGSDEDPKFCTKTVTSPISIISISPSRSITSTLSPWIPKQPIYCLVPPQPANGKWQLYKLQCQTQENCDVQQGVQLYIGAYLVYTCNPGYKINGSPYVLCDLEGKWLNIPVCTGKIYILNVIITKNLLILLYLYHTFTNTFDYILNGYTIILEIRCKSLTSASTNAVCTYNGKWTACESPVLPETIAILNCRNGYHEDTLFLSKPKAQVRCNKNGQWEPEPIKCIPVCGVFTPSTKPLIIYENAIDISLFPWHATLYETKSPDGPKEFTCGATIIKDNLLVTAAHCVFDERSKKINDPKRYYIATGNIFRDYESPLHDPHFVKKAQVENIYIPCNYLGLEGNYAWDIALLKIDVPFVFSAFLLPACLDQTFIEFGYGIVAGFSRTTLGASSFILQSAILPYVPLNQCKSVSSAQSEKFIMPDKFCAGYTNGTSICDGYSGGGLVFQTGNLWFLRGIVSIGVTLSAGSEYCYSYSYTLNTRISSHIDWIQDIILRLESSNPLPLCHNLYHNIFL